MMPFTRKPPSVLFGFLFTCTVLQTACATESASVAYLGRSREWREHRIRKSLQQSCHLDHAAKDQHNLLHAPARAYKPLTAPNRVPSVRSQQPTSAPRHPPNGRQQPPTAAPKLTSAQLGSPQSIVCRHGYNMIFMVQNGLIGAPGARWDAHAHKGPG